MDLPSGDQKGNLPPSVPGSALTVPFSMERRNSICFPSITPANTRLLPSWEMAGAPPWSPSVRRVTSGGRLRLAWTTGPAVSRRLSRKFAARPAAMSTKAPSADTSTLFRNAFFGGGENAKASAEDCEIQLISCLMSAALCQRSSGIFARHFRMT